MFFRIPTVIFIFLSIFVAEQLKKGKGKKNILFSLILLVIGVFFTSNYADRITRYTRSYNTILRTKSGIQKPGNFLRSTAALAGIFGPFPTITPVLRNRDTVMHGPTLILKGFLSTYFLFVVYFVWRRKEFNILPILLFSLMHIISLSYLIQTFKLRNHFTYLPFFISLSFYVIYIIHREPDYKRIKFVINGINIGLVLVIFFWNLLRF
jgi:hypothetical protein